MQSIARTAVQSVKSSATALIRRRLLTERKFNNMAKRIKLIGDVGEEEWKRSVTAAYQCLKSNKVIAVPTDTIYGIAGLAQSSDAVNQIYEIKNRNTSNPVAICVGDVGDIKQWGNVTTPQGLLEDLLPGPVTVVLERTEELNPSLNPGTLLVGIRVPDYGFIRDVVRECGEPLALTSANISGGRSSLQVEEFNELWPKLGMIFDGGSLGNAAEERAGSTVVDLSQAGHYKIIRNGSAFKETSEKLKEYGLKEILPR